VFKASVPFKVKLSVLMCAVVIAGGVVMPAATMQAMAQQSDAPPAATTPSTNLPASNAPASTTQTPVTGTSEPVTAPAQAAPAQNPAAQQEPANTVPVAPATQPFTLAPQEPAPQNTAPSAVQTPHVAENGLQIPHDLSPWGMFMAADWVVKGVMIGLALASLATWTVWLAKSVEITGARSRARRALKEVSHAENLAGAVQVLARTRGPGAHLVRAAQEEVAISAPAVAYVGGEGLKERVSSRLSRIESGAGRRLAKGTGILATIGSVAPFVGLFGTVWGIMNSFIGISEAQTTNLAVVAPGIAEALLATAIGLVAAIPAVIIYNIFARSVTGYRHLLADVSAGVERLVSRDIDMRAAREMAQKQSVNRPAAPNVQGAATKAAE